MKILRTYRPLMMWMALLLIGLIFQVLTGGLFLSPDNLVNLMKQSAIVGILASGMVLVMVCGHIDLSVGSMLGLLGGFAAILTVQAGLPLPLVIVATLLAGLFIGALQGVLVAYFRIPAFIVTLGGLLIFRGLISAWMKGATIPVAGDFRFFGNGFLNIWQSWLLGLWSLGAGVFFIIKSWRDRKKYGMPAGNRAALAGRIMLLLVGVAGLLALFTHHAFSASQKAVSTPIRVPESSPLYHSGAYQAAMHQAASSLVTAQALPMPVLVMGVLALLIGLFSTRMVTGRRLFAIGGNPDAAWLSGIFIPRHIVLVFALCGSMAAVAGIIFTGRLGSAAPDAARGYELYAIAACVIGGTSLRGGRGTVTGALTGALIMASLDNGMSLLNVDPFYQDIFKGAVLVAAVYLDVRGRSAPR